MQGVKRKTGGEGDGDTIPKFENAFSSFVSELTRSRAQVSELKRKEQAWLVEKGALLKTIREKEEGHKLEISTFKDKQTAWIREKEVLLTQIRQKDEELEGSRLEARELEGRVATLEGKLKEERAKSLQLKEKGSLFQLAKEELMEWDDITQPSSEQEETEVDEETFLINRLRTMYASGRLFSTALQGTISDDEQQQLFNPLIMNLWRITRFPVRYDCREFLSVKQSISVISQFLHTGLVGREDVKKFLRGCAVPIVNHFVVGLFLIEGLSGVPVAEIENLISDLPPNAPLIISTMLATFVPVKSDKNRDWIMGLHELIEDKWREQYEDDFLLDMEQEGNYSYSDKFYFFYWLYHRLSLSRAHSALAIALSSLGSTFYETDSVELEFTDTDELERKKIYVHSLLLLLLQNREFGSFPNDVENVKEAFPHVMIRKDRIQSFVKMLCEPSSTQRSTLESMSCVVVVQLSLAFGVDKPLSMFYDSSKFETPYATKLALEFYVRTNDFTYISELPREASRLLVWENFSLVEPHQLVSLMKLDELQINEKKLFDFVIEYASKRKRERQVLATLLPYIRYATMEDDEFELVSHHPYLKEDEKVKFWLHINTERRPRIPEKFFRPTTQRIARY